jgi:DNA-directed RNA polymerase specialized sigma24 family protein
VAVTGSPGPELPDRTPAGLGAGGATAGAAPADATSARGTAARLWPRLVAGDPTALADAYDRYADRLHTVARATASPADAAAVVRATFVRLWEHPLGYPAGDDDLAAALAAVTRRLAAERAAPGTAERARRRPAAGPPVGVTGADPRAALLASALAHRPATAATPAYAAPFAAWTAVVDRVLAELRIRDWDRPTGDDGRTPREVVARLAGLNAALAAAIGIPVARTLARAGADTPAQGIIRAGVSLSGGAVGDPVAGPPRAETAGRAARPGPGGTRSASLWPAVVWPPLVWPPVLLWRTWHDGARGLCAWLAGREPSTAGLSVDALGWTAPVADHLTARLLGTWIDGGTLAAAAGVPIPPLGLPELRAATHLALGRLREPNGPAGAVRPLLLTLTYRDGLPGRPGPAAAGPAPGAGRTASVLGSWPVSLGGAEASQEPTGPGAEVCVDAVDFCLLATGRRTPAETAQVADLGHVPAAAHALFTAAAGVLPA